MLTDLDALQHVRKEREAIRRQMEHVVREMHQLEGELDFDTRPASSRAAVGSASATDSDLTTSGREEKRRRVAALRAELNDLRARMRKGMEATAAAAAAGAAAGFHNQMTEQRLLQPFLHPYHQHHSQQQRFDRPELGGSARAGDSPFIAYPHRQPTPLSAYSAQFLPGASATATAPPTPLADRATDVTASHGVNDEMNDDNDNDPRTAAEAEAARGELAERQRGEADALEGYIVSLRRHLVSAHDAQRAELERRLAEEAKCRRQMVAAQRRFETARQQTRAAMAAQLRHGNSNTATSTDVAAHAYQGSVPFTPPPDFLAGLSAMGRGLASPGPAR